MMVEPLLADRESWKPERCSIDKAISTIGTRSAILLLREAFYDDGPLKVVDTRTGSPVRVRMQNAEGEDVALDEMGLTVRRDE
ncbi:hypothetical protein Caci_4745 [Catenulispora acidiphila DSM 44928]|uniref:Uncharacterized protein n=1 Tax=Catenulispora acidiphila (strain DSM 44928 / JCM 14897 / NBRC 102108 / NRRL B-24433 / ID139908) TaxID=479433 RepID=C7PZU1_CATAD|nr:hypothetical protein [Catenulispora acidiphila]ACU73606.1 hypothetical protein Caci_4745 [Catenulispora acidiphila DSM 44928]